MAEIERDTNSIKDYSVKTLADSILVRTSASLGYEDGSPDPLTPGWEASCPIPQETIVREIIKKVSGGIQEDEAREASTRLSRAEKMLKIDVYLTDEQIVDKKRIVAVNGYVRSSLGEGTRTSENLSNPWSPPPKFSNSPVASCVIGSSGRLQSL